MRLLPDGVYTVPVAFLLWPMLKVILRKTCHEEVAPSHPTRKDRRMSFDENPKDERTEVDLCVEQIHSLQRELAEARAERDLWRATYRDWRDGEWVIPFHVPGSLVAAAMESAPAPSDAKGDHIVEPNKLVPLTDPTVRGVLVDDGERPANFREFFLEHGEVHQFHGGICTAYDVPCLKLRPASDFGVAYDKEVEDAYTSDLQEFLVEIGKALDLTYDYEESYESLTQRIVEAVAARGEPGLKKLPEGARVVIPCPPSQESDFFNPFNRQLIPQGFYKALDPAIYGLPDGGERIKLEENPNCCGCGKPLEIDNAWMEDGCPCNTPRGVNDLNKTRWRLLHDLQQAQSRHAERQGERIKALEVEVKCWENRLGCTNIEVNRARAEERRLGIRIKELEAELADWKQDSADELCINCADPLDYQRRADDAVRADAERLRNQNRELAGLYENMKDQMEDADMEAGRLRKAIGCAHQYACVDRNATAEDMASVLAVVRMELATALSPSPAATSGEKALPLSSTVKDSLTVAEPSTAPVIKDSLTTAEPTQASASGEKPFCPYHSKAWCYCKPASAPAAESGEKLKLPPTEFFYNRAMEVSTEIKSRDIAGPTVHKTGSPPANIPEYMKRGELSAACPLPKADDPSTRQWEPTLPASDCDDDDEFDPDDIENNVADLHRRLRVAGDCADQYLKERNALSSRLAACEERCRELDRAARQANGILYPVIRGHVVSDCVKAAVDVLNGVLAPKAGGEASDTISPTVPDSQ